jgi:PAS domain S-box-containing protein
MSGISEVFEEGGGGAELSAFFYLVVSSPQATSVHDESGELAMFNPSCTSLLGYDPGELSTLAAPNIVHPDDVELLNDATSRARETDSGNQRLRLVHKSGDSVLVDMEMTRMVVAERPLLVVVSTPVSSDGQDPVPPVSDHSAL